MVVSLISLISNNWPHKTMRPHPRVSLRTFPPPFLPFRGTESQITKAQKQIQSEIVLRVNTLHFTFYSMLILEKNTTPRFLSSDHIIWCNRPTISHLANISQCMVWCKKIVAKPYLKYGLAMTLYVKSCPGHS